MSTHCEPIPSTANSAGDRTGLLVNFGPHAMASSTLAICITDGCVDRPGPHIEYVNQAYLDLFCCEREDVIGRSPRFGQGTLTDRSVLDRIRVGLSRGESVRAQAVNYRLSGEAFHLRWTIDPICAADGVVTNFVAVLADVTAEDRLRRRLIALDSFTHGCRTGRAEGGLDDMAMLVAESIRPFVKDLGAVEVCVGTTSNHVTANVDGRAGDTSQLVHAGRVELGRHGWIDLAIHEDAEDLIDMTAVRDVVNHMAWTLSVIGGRPAAGARRVAASLIG